MLRCEIWIQDGERLVAMFSDDDGELGEMLDASRDEVIEEIAQALVAEGHSTVETLVRRRHACGIMVALPQEALSINRAARRRAAEIEDGETIREGLEL